LSWTSGNGDGRVVKLNDSNSFTAPTDGSDPTADASWNGSGEQVIFNNTGSTVDITNLTADDQYYITIYERNCSSTSTNFNISSAPLSTIITPNGTPASEETIFSESFETDGHGSRYTASSTGGFNDGTSDHFNRTNGSDIANVTGVYSNMDGTYFWAAEDTDDDGGDGLDEQTISFTGIDISGYTDITFKGLFGAGNENGTGASTYDAADFIKITYEIDDGGEQNGIWFSYENNGDSFNEPIGLDSDFDGNADVNGTNRLGNAMQEFSFNMSTGSLLDITVKIYMDAGSEEAAVDNLRIIGTSAGGSTTASDHFRTCTSGSYNSASTWQSATTAVPTTWYLSSLVPDQSATSITISEGTSVSHTSDITFKEFIIKDGSDFSFSADNQTLTVSGDLTIESGGTLELSRTGTKLQLNGTSLQTLTNSGTSNIYNLEINNINHVDMSGDLTVDNQLILSNGRLNCTSNTLTIDNTAEASVTGQSATSYVNGTLKRKINSAGSYEFPIGIASNYEWAKIDLNSSVGISYLTASFSSTITGAAPNLTVNSVQISTFLNAGIWTISPDAITSVNYDLTLISKGHTNGGVSSDYHTLLKRDNSSSSWGEYGSFDVAEDQLFSRYDLN